MSTAWINVALVPAIQRSERSDLVAVASRNLENAQNFAQENNIPILERPELARDLYANVGIGEDIPERFYKAIAEILAFVYRLRKR